MKPLDTKYRTTFIRMIILCSSLAMLFLSGCTHTMHITNADKFALSPTVPLAKPVKLGIISGNEVHPQNKRYVAAIVESLQKNSNVSQVVYPYRRTENDGIDTVANITVNPRYDGVGSNFLVEFPGFIIFAPSIWGYGYQAAIDTQVLLVDAKDSTRQEQLSIPCNYEFRHADMGRTWTEGAGWITWVVPLVGGFTFTGFDESITDEFITKVSPSYGPFIATKIVAAIKLPEIQPQAAVGASTAASPAPTPAAGAASPASGAAPGSQTAAQ